MGAWQRWVLTWSPPGFPQKNQFSLPVPGDLRRQVPEARTLGAGPMGTREEHSQFINVCVAVMAPRWAACPPPLPRKTSQFVFSTHSTLQRAASTVHRVWMDKVWGNGCVFGPQVLFPSFRNRPAWCTWRVEGHGVICELLKDKGWGLDLNLFPTALAQHRELGRQPAAAVRSRLTTAQDRALAALRPAGGSVAASAKGWLLGPAAG